MKSMIDQVYEFNEQLLRIPFPVSPSPMSDAFAKHLKKALNEEADEFMEGHEQHDFIKQIDSCLDSIYFALGGLYKLGIRREQVVLMFTAVHVANMEKVKGKVASRDIEGSVDAVKPANWVPPEEAIALILDETTV